MVYNISSKNCRISTLLNEEIVDNIKKVLRHLPKIEGATEQLYCVIKRHQGKDFYEVSITLYLPIDNLYSRSESYDAQECIHESFKKLIEEVRRYKETHLVSDGRYPHHNSIKK